MTFLLLTFCKCVPICSYVLTWTARYILNLFCPDWETIFYDYNVYSLTFSLVFLCFQSNHWLQHTVKMFLHSFMQSFIHSQSVSYLCVTLTHSGFELPLRNFHHSQQPVQRHCKDMERQWQQQTAAHTPAGAFSLADCSACKSLSQNTIFKLSTTLRVYTICITTPHVQSFMVKLPIQAGVSDTSHSFLVACFDISQVSKRNTTELNARTKSTNYTICDFFVFTLNRIKTLKTHCAIITVNYILFLPC